MRLERIAMPRRTRRPPARTDNAAKPAAANSRLETIVEDLRLRPRDAVLEVGCGHGVAADLICQRLRGGRFVAIDRSPTMIAAAQRRNAAHVATGVAVFHVADVQTYHPGHDRFDIILAVRVGLFHREPQAADRLLARWLKPRGRIVLHYDAP